MNLTDDASKRLERLKRNNDELAQQRQATKPKPFRIDGYVNLLNKYGTAQDNSEAYTYSVEGETDDTILTQHYETNGLFAKIIDVPAQEAVKKSFSLNITDSSAEEYLMKKVRKLKFFTQVEEALKWSRLYGGALAVMIIDDGANDLTMPVNWKRAKKIEEIVVYEEAVVTPDYGSMYSNYGMYGEKTTSKFRMPEYYNVFSIYGSFRVHESRCLLFRNGRMPEKASTTNYRFWGIPEYNRIKRSLRETITTHSNAVKLLDRSVQAVYKMKNLAQLLSMDGGEEQVLKRLQVIDMARGILNSIAIDNDGEDYDFKSITLTGVQEVIESTCSMLSALTEIPQTKLFGRSPAGMNATGESDLENYYSFIDKIRETQIRDNLCSLIDGLIQIGLNTGELKERPDYELEFEPLWTEKESEKSAIDSQNAQTDFTKAQTAQLYIDMGVLDPSEERRRLKDEGKFGIEDEELPQQSDDQFEQLLASLDKKEHADSAGIPTGVGVIVVKDGKILVGNRDDTNEVGGPGGHIEDWEDAEQAARRETEEEFGIEIEDLTPLCFLSDLPKQYGISEVFLSTRFKNSPQTNTQEMRNNRFTELSDLKNEVLYEPFKQSLEKLLFALQQDKDLTSREIADTINTDEGWKEEDHPRDENGRFTSGSGKSTSPKSKENKTTDKSKTEESEVSQSSKSKSSSAEKTSASSSSSENSASAFVNTEIRQETAKPKQQRKLAVPEGAELRDKIISGKATADDILNDPVIKDAIKKYTVEAKDYTSVINTPEREIKRQEVANEIVSHGSISGKDEKGNPIYGGPVKKGYRAEIVIGPPAAGKSSVIVDRVSQYTQSRVLDSDDIKALLPEFDEGRGAGKVHEESSDILNSKVLPQFYSGGAHEGENIVIPIVGSTANKSRKYLAELKKAGYEVHLSFNDVTAENSLQRAILRYIDTGRFINPSYILGIGDRPSRTYDILKAEGGFDSYSKYDNNVPKGQKAIEIERITSKK